jgi:hypothetical protein
MCTGIELKELESLLGTAVGVGFILPVVYQLLHDRSKNLITSASLLIAELEDEGDRSSMLDLASFRIKFQRQASRMNTVSHGMILISSISALIAFLSCITSVFAKLCLSLMEVATLVSVVSMPILCCAWLFIWWWDASRPVISRMRHYYE